MNNLKSGLQKIQSRLLEQERIDKKLRAKLRETLELIFSNKNPSRFIRDFYLKDQKLTFITTNKSFAHTLFLSREEIIHEIEKAGIKLKEIIIK